VSSGFVRANSENGWNSERGQGLRRREGKAQPIAPRGGRTHTGGHSGYRDIDRCDDGRDNHRSWITGYGWNRFAYRLTLRDHSVAVDVSRIVTLDRIVDGRDPARISGAGVVDRDGHDESSQQDQSKDKGPSIPSRRQPPCRA
jgi:hypothetical protein